MTAQPAEELVLAIITGDTDTVASLLAANPDLANHRLPGNDRSMLHYATDWPGHYPNVATTIGLLVAAGADPDAAMPPGDSPGVAETPLHWAASSDDVAAVRALLDAGATVDALGGIFGGCTPFVEATIFEQYGAAQLLLDGGATNWLPGAAALGHADMVAGFFDDDGNLRDDIGQLLHDDLRPNAPSSSTGRSSSPAEPGISRSRSSCWSAAPIPTRSDRRTRRLGTKPPRTTTTRSSGGSTGSPDR